MTEVWPVALDEPLPTVPVPLSAGDPDVGLDLQDAFTEAYKISKYDLIIDYSRPPDGPFTKEEGEKAKEILAQANR